MHLFLALTEKKMVPLEDVDLDQERIERTYKELHGSQYYMGYIGLSGLFSFLLDMRALLAAAQVITGDSTLVDFTEVLIIAGILFELGWVARMAQIENIAKVKNKLFFMDVFICLNSIIFFLVESFFPSYGGFFDLLWLTPCVVRAGYLGMRSMELAKQAALEVEQGKAKESTKKIGLPSVPIGKMATSLMMKKIRG